MKSKMQINVIGNDAELKEFVKLCQYIQSFGSYGMSRCLHVNTDGDGSGRLHFIGEDGGELPNIPLEQLHAIESELGEFNVDIGE